MGHIVDIFIHLCSCNMKSPKTDPCHLFLKFLSLDYEKYDWGDNGSVGRVLSLQAKRSEFGPKKPRKNVRHGSMHM